MISEKYFQNVNNFIIKLPYYFDTTSAMRLYSSDGDFRTRFLVGTLKKRSSTVIIVPWLAAHGIDLPTGFPSQYDVYK